MTAHRSRSKALILIGAGSFLAPTAVFADPCTAPLPSPGAQFSGVVRYIGDGDGLCVGPMGRPDRWIEVRLADFYAPELHERGGEQARQRLRSLVFGRTVACVADHRSYDRIVAACMVNGKPPGDELRRLGGIEGGRGIPRR
ncbi:nuclease [uncultured Sphingomonas sp.]|uniref:thermonuclease family protein n=1 Tax=uncultured Sphingomonas sp. TaxID=158754 RepID=UPI0026295585|nr:nuclease [uncultured Sphingomonas sp.]